MAAIVAVLNTASQLVQQSDLSRFETAIVTAYSLSRHAEVRTELTYEIDWIPERQIWRWFLRCQRELE